MLVASLSLLGMHTDSARMTTTTNDQIEFVACSRSTCTEYFRLPSVMQGFIWVFNLRRAVIYPLSYLPLQPPIGSVNSLPFSSSSCSSESIRKICGRSGLLYQ